jgi:hypothetical protein
LDPVFTGSGLSTLVTDTSKLAGAARMRLGAASETSNKTLNKSNRLIATIFFICVSFAWKLSGAAGRLFVVATLRMNQIPADLYHVNSPGANNN